MADNRSLVFLIGARGTGKTATAELLAGRLGRAWCDADVLLEQRAGRTIREIFEGEGQAGFRDRESAILREVASWHDYVVATGGGVVLRAENRLLLRRGAVVWLSAPADVLWQRLQADSTTLQRRPNLAQGGLLEIEAVLKERDPLYAACADLQLDTAQQAPQEIADRIAAWLHGAA
jgi:shikimate kinase